MLHRTPPRPLRPTIGNTVGLTARFSGTKLRTLALYLSLSGHQAFPPYHFVFAERRRPVGQPPIPVRSALMKYAFLATEQGRSPGRAHLRRPGGTLRPVGRVQPPTHTWGLVQPPPQNLASTLNPTPYTLHPEPRLLERQNDRPNLDC